MSECGAFTCRSHRAYGVYAVCYLPFNELLISLLIKFARFKGRYKGAHRTDNRIFVHCLSFLKMIVVEFLGVKYFFATLVKC